MAEGVRILVTNDDGVHSEGLHALVKALHSVGEVAIVAPDRERSAVAHSLTLHHPLRVEQIGPQTYSVNGTPTDCVNLALNGLLRHRGPHLVVSGINKGGNLGDDVTYSGTVMAAMEGAMLGLPALAVSLATKVDFLFEPAARFAARLAAHVLREGLPAGTMLNVNVPNLPEEALRPARITRLGRRIYSNGVVEKVDPRGRTYYWLGGADVGYQPGEGTDVEAVAAGHVSITPLHFDLTHYSALDLLRRWQL
ncbi:MAG: 5'/3'-nucleotidase SurE [Deltaproteobacteria bacterium]|nr:5'/3'-nucleotidase SurE [Deltaproteobacteria bacterium]